MGLHADHGDEKQAIRRPDPSRFCTSLPKNRRRGRTHRDGVRDPAQRLSLLPRKEPGRDGTSKAGAAAPRNSLPTWLLPKARVPIVYIGNLEQYPLLAICVG